MTSLGQAGQSDSCIEGVLMRSPRVSYDSATATHSPCDPSPRGRLRSSGAVSGAGSCGSGARLRGGPPSACHSTEALPSCGRLGVLQERPVQAPLPHPQVICTVSSDLLPGFLSKPQAPPPRVPHRPARVSGLGAQAVAQTLCVAVALSYLPQAAQCPLLQAPEAPSCPSRSVCW